MPSDPLAWIDDELDRLESAGLRRHLSTRESTQAADCICLDGRPLLNFGSNDYLGLAAEALNDAIIDSVRRVGWGSGASPLVTGRGAMHAALEDRLAEFEGTESALLFPSGFAANVGTIAALFGKGDVIFSDAKNHASIIDGCRLSRADVHVYPHCDVDHLRGALSQASRFRRRLIVTDTLFSMDGDLAPLSDLADLAERFDAMLMVDEAHATGVFGHTGRGVCQYLDVESGIHVRIGTLSKALGSIGGFVVGTTQLVQWLSNRAHTYVFSTSPPEAVAAAGLHALEIVQTEPQRRRTVLEHADTLRAGLQEHGWFCGDSASQIVPVRIGDARQTTQMADALRQRGLFVPGIRPPTVPDGESLLRISLSYPHTKDMLRQLLGALGQLRRGSVGEQICQ